MVNPLLYEWDYKYDVRNRQIEEDQPLVTDATTGLASHPAILTGCDYAGNVLWKQDARGNATVTTYDEANRPVTTTQPSVWAYGSFAAQPAISRLYDPAGNALTFTDANGHVATNQYDALNQLKAHRRKRAEVPQSKIGMVPRSPER